MLTFIALLVLAMSSVALAGYAFVTDQRRRAVLDRALGAEAAVPARSVLVSTVIPGEKLGKAIRSRFEHLLPSRWLTDERTRALLVRAGYDGEHALYVYAGARVAALLVVPATAFMLELGRPMGELLLALVGSVVAAVIVPRGIVDGMVRRRQEQLRRAVPDALDLLLVCVEAGNSLETAIVRVARELQTVHPILAGELALVMRRTRAGMPRTEALRGLVARTGVDELRALVTNIIQSERWGTSIARVLRVSAETLRRKRRQAVERKAQMAPVKMTIPLIVLILPALFVVLLGPSILTLITALSGTTSR